MKLKYTAVAGAADSTDAAHHGSFVGTPTFHSASATGNGYGMGFGPAVSDAHVSVPHHADFAQAAFSVEFWARLDDATTNEWGTPVAKSTSNQWNDGWGFYDRQSTGEFTFWVDTYDAHPTPAASARYISIARPAPASITTTSARSTEPPSRFTWTAHWPGLPRRFLLPLQALRQCCLGTGILTVRMARYGG